MSSVQDKPTDRVGVDCGNLDDVTKTWRLWVQNNNDKIRMEQNIYIISPPERTLDEWVGKGTGAGHM